MGLKGYRLWVMGQLDSNAQRPTLGQVSRTATDASHPSIGCLSVVASAV
jgi:hypothetical protein